MGGETTCWKERLSNELNTIKDKCNGLETELDRNNELLEGSKERYGSLEREFQLLKEERESLLKTVSESSQKFTLLPDQKENVVKDLNTEVQRRKDLEEEIKQFTSAFASRQRSLAAFHSELRSKVENLRAQNPLPVSKSLT